MHNKKALKNYLAVFKLLKMIREDLKRYPHTDFHLSVIEKRRELIKEAKDLLRDAKCLRVNAL